MTSERASELRIHALGAAISRRDWHAVEAAHAAIRDAAAATEGADMSNTYAQRQARFPFVRDTNGCLIGPSECHHDSKSEAMYFDQLELCGCGHPQEVHALLVECAAEFSQGKDFKTSNVWGVERLVAANPARAAEFIAHFLDQKDLLDHGSSVFGSWLTERGKQFVEIGASWEDDVADDEELVAVHEDEAARLSVEQPHLGGLKAVGDRCDSWIERCEAGQVVDVLQDEYNALYVRNALHDALRTLCLQREGHFHTASAWATARALVGLEPEAAP